MKSVTLFLVTTDHGTTRAMDFHCLHLQEGEKWEIVLAVLREGINFPLMPPPQKLTVKVNFLLQDHCTQEEQGPNCEAEKEK